MDILQQWPEVMVELTTDAERHFREVKVRRFSEAYNPRRDTGHRTTVVLYRYHNNAIPTSIQTLCGALYFLLSVVYFRIRPSLYFVFDHCMSCLFIKRSGGWVGGRAYRSCYLVVSNMHSGHVIESFFYPSMVVRTN